MAKTMRDVLEGVGEHLADRIRDMPGEIGQKLQAMAESHAANEVDTTGRLGALGGRTDALGNEIHTMYRPQV